MCDRGIQPAGWPPDESLRFGTSLPRSLDAIGDGLAVMTVGAIQGPDHVNTILAAGRADLCALARPHLVSPHIVLGASAAYEYFDQPWPKQYLPAKPKPR